MMYYFIHRSIETEDETVRRVVRISLKFKWGSVKKYLGIDSKEEYLRTSEGCKEDEIGRDGETWIMIHHSFVVMNHADDNHHYHNRPDVHC